MMITVLRFIGLANILARKISGAQRSRPAGNSCDILRRRTRRIMSDFPDRVNKKGAFQDRAFRCRPRQKTEHRKNVLTLKVRGFYFSRPASDSSFFRFSMSTPSLMTLLPGPSVPHGSVRLYRPAVHCQEIWRRPFQGPDFYFDIFLFLTVLAVAMPVGKTAAACQNSGLFSVRRGIMLIMLRRAEFKHLHDIR